MSKPELIKQPDRNLYIEREDRVNTNRKNIGFGFWLVWILANILGFGLGAVLSIVILASAHISKSVTFPILFGAIFGAVASLAQWMVIRRHAQEAGLWIPFSAVAFMLSATTAASWSQSTSPDFNPFFIVAGIYGLLGGFLQWLLLEKRGIPAIWWIVASVIGGMLGGAMNGSAVVAAQSSEAWNLGTTTFFLTWFRLGAPFGLGLGITTGAVLFWFSRHPKIKSQDEAENQKTR